MTESITHEIDGGALYGQGLCTFVGENDGDCVEEHGRGASQLSVSLQQRAIGKLRAAHFGGDDFHGGTRLRGGQFDLLDNRAVRSIRHQDANGAPHERVLHLPDDLQGGRRRHLPHGSCGRRRIGHCVQRQTRRDPFGQLFLNMPQVADHRLTHMPMFDLGKLEHQRRGEMRLLIGGLAEIELPRLAVVVGKALGTDAAFFAAFSHRTAMKAVGRRFAR